MVQFNLKSHIYECKTGTAYFEDGKWEAFPLKEASNQMDQVVKRAAGKVGQLPELVP